MFCIRSRKLIIPEKIRGCKSFSGWNITQNDFFKIQDIQRMFLWWYILRKSGSAKFFRKSFEFFWIQYRPWKHQVMIICWENKDFKQQLSPEHFLNLYHKTPQRDHILIKSANHTFFTIAWIWGHVVNTCLLHFQVCGWSSGRKTHFETFSR